jgi:hypothetical protein
MMAQPFAPSAVNNESPCSWAWSGGMGLYIASQTTKTHTTAQQPFGGLQPCMLSSACSQLQRDGVRCPADLIPRPLHVSIFVHTCICQAHAL